MSKLIEALQVFLKYGDHAYPTNCSHDELTVCHYDRAKFSDEDILKLEELGFTWSNSSEGFYSFKYGSC